MQYINKYVTNYPVQKNQSIKQEGKQFVKGINKRWFCNIPKRDTVQPVICLRFPLRHMGIVLSTVVSQTTTDYHLWLCYELSRN